MSTAVGRRDAISSPAARILPTLITGREYGVCRGRDGDPFGSQAGLVVDRVKPAKESGFGYPDTSPGSAYWLLVVRRAGLVTRAETPGMDDDFRTLPIATTAEQRSESSLGCYLRVDLPHSGTGPLH